MTDGEHRATPDQVLAFRLRRQGLVEPREREAGPSDLASAARAACGIQAQVLRAAEVGLGVRTHGIGVEAVGRALWSERRLVKTWTLRGTLHLVAAEDHPLFVGALRPDLLRDVEAWMGREGLGQGRLQRLDEAVGQALEEGPLTRRELAGAVIGRLGSWAEPWMVHSWGGALKHAAIAGRICFGPPRGQEVTFVRTDRWLPPAPEPTDDGSALGRLALRYLASFGPASEQDFAYWSGVRVGTARRAFAAWGEELVWVSVGDGLREDLPGGWIHRDDLEDLAAASVDEERVHLLPSFDAYLLGHKEKALFLDGRHRTRVCRPAGWVAPVVLRNGRVIGTWAHKTTGRTLKVTVALFGRSNRKLRGCLEDAGARLGAFLDLDPAVGYGPATTAAR